MVLLCEGESVVVLVGLIVGEGIALETDFGELSAELEFDGI